MGTGYTRADVSNNIADGNIINASDLDSEFDAVQAAFDAATGHTHDGTTGEGAPIEVTGPAQEYVSTNTELRPKANNTYDLGSAANQWKDLYVDGTANLDAVDIDGGNIDGTTIGAATPAAGTFTTATATTGNITTVNATTVDTTNIEVTNIKAKDGTSAGSIADATGVVTLASSVLTTTDINGGTIDGATIATSDITVGAGKTLNVSAGTLTLANDQISGDKVEGGTINAITINTLGSTTGNITTVNATTVDSTNVEVTNIKAKDGTASATIADSTGVMTIASSVLTSADINGGTIDGTVIGGASAAAGTFTTVTASGDVDIADKIVHTGDTNTAIRFPAADTVTVETAGTERVRIDASGNVGIGTSSPSANLYVAGTGVTQLYLADTGEATDQKIWGFQYGTGIGAGTFRLRALNDAVTNGQNAYIITRTGFSVDTHQWLTAGTERMRIDSSGNVGIGTSSPATKLDVSGNLRFSAANPVIELNNGGAQIYSTAANTLQFASGGGIGSPTERMRIDSSGNVGIGTSSPQKALNVVASSSSTTIGGSTAVVQVGNSSGAALNLTAGVELFGSGAPSSGLGNRSAGIYGVYEAFNAGGNAGALVLATNPAGTTSVAERMRVTSTGSVGIGTSSPTDGKLVITGSAVTTAQGVRLTGDTADARFICESATIGAGILGTFSNHSQLFYTNSTERARIDSSGNLLVGTTTGGHKLLVNDATNRSEADAQFRIGGNGYSFYSFLDGTACHLGQNSSVRSLRLYSGSSSGTGVELSAGGTSWGTYSDERVKTALKPIEDALDKVSSLRAVTGRYLTDEETVSRSFLIAQDVQAVLPEAVDVGTDENKTLLLKYTEVMPLLVAAIKEQQVIIEALKARITALEAQP